MKTGMNIGRTGSLVLILLATAAVGCGSDKKKGGGGGGEEEPAAETDPNTGEQQETPQGETTVNGDNLDSLDSAKKKVRNFTQFWGTYTSLLEIPDNDQNLVDFFQPIKTNLPTLTSAAGFLGSHQLALVKFGSKSCERSWDINTSADARSKIFGVEAGNVPTEVLSDENKLVLARHMIARFWGQDFDALTDDDANVKTVSQLIKDSVDAMTEFNPATTAQNQIKYAVVGACTAVITSAGVSFYGQ